MLAPGLFILLLFTPLAGEKTSHSQDNDTEPLSPRYLYNKFRFGTSWRVYLHALAYDLVYSSMSLGILSTNNNRGSLLDVTYNIPTVIRDRSPCRSLSWIVAWQFRAGLLTGLHSNYFPTHHLGICGLYNVTYIPSVKETGVISNLFSLPEKFSAREARGGFIFKPANMTFYHILTWNVSAHGTFGINLTISEFTAPSSYGCQDAKLEVYFGSDSPDFTVICPNWSPMRFINSHFTVNFFFNLPWYETAGKHRNTKLSMQYQIIEYRNFVLKVDGWFPSTSKLPILQKEYIFRVNFPDLDISTLMLFATQRSLAYVISFTAEGYFTPVVVRKNVVCDDSQTEIIFYDGYSEILLQEFQPILKIWRCTESYDGIAGHLESEEVRGSIGTLSTVVFLFRTSAKLSITYQTQRMLPSVFRRRRIELTSSEKRTIRLLPRQSTAFEVVDIVAPEGKFVRLRFSEIKFVPSRHLVMYDLKCMAGIYIKDPLDIHIVHGLICSNTTAEDIVKQTKKAGLTMGHSVTISLRQYW